MVCPYVVGFNALAIAKAFPEFMPPNLSNVYMSVGLFI
jgi:hypothetical protein